jgi:hypothetical protein
MVAAVVLQFLDGWTSKLWSRFFCLSVYVTMYLNDHQRSAFYESLGLNTTQFNRCPHCLKDLPTSSALYPDNIGDHCIESPTSLMHSHQGYL